MFQGLGKSRGLEISWLYQLVDLVFCYFFCGFDQVIIIPWRVKNRLCRRGRGRGAASTKSILSAFGKCICIDLGC